jgi:hypothetical protein
MTDHHLEQRLRAWYRAEIDDRESAPLELRAELPSFAQTAATARVALVPGWRLPAVLRFASLTLAAAAVLVIVLVGTGLIVWPPDVGPPPGPITPSTPAASVTASATEGEVLNGWPDTSRNLAGVYSWDGARCGRPPFPSGSHCIIGLMHNGYGSNDVEIRLGRPPREAIIGGAGTAVTVAGHDGIYRRIDDLREEWVVDIEETTIVIHLSARPGTSQSDLDEAHAIIDSLRAEPRDNDVGFRLVFTLTTDDWDSG